MSLRAPFSRLRLDDDDALRRRSYHVGVAAVGAAAGERWLARSCAKQLRAFAAGARLDAVRCGADVDVLVAATLECGDALACDDGARAAIRNLRVAEHSSVRSGLAAALDLAGAWRDEARVLVAHRAQARNLELRRGADRIRVHAGAARGAVLTEHARRWVDPVVSAARRRDEKQRGAAFCDRVFHGAEVRESWLPEGAAVCVHGTVTRRADGALELGPGAKWYDAADARDVLAAGRRWHRRAALVRRLLVGLAVALFASRVVLYYVRKRRAEAHLLRRRALAERPPAAAAGDVETVCKVCHDERLCAVCCDANVDTVLIPCGHALFCRSCATRAQRDSDKCPICRQRVIHVQRVYHP